MNAKTFGLTPVVTEINAARIRTEEILARDAERYRKIRAARGFVGMLEFVTAHADTDADYDAAVDTLPEEKS